MRRKLIVVSNRGPVSYTTAASGELVGRRGGGGLATALRGLLSLHEVTWIASAISAEDRGLAGEARPETGRDGTPFRLRFVAHDEQTYDRYYNVVANPMLWFVQHYLWELAYTPRIDQAFHVAWDEGYAAVNGGFAAAVLDELDRQPDAAVFFHDYHLYLAPRLVRTAAPDATLMHFVHVPWAQPDYWHILPERIRFAIHDGMLANDVVGFHCDRWRQNFLDCVRDIVGDAGSVRTITAPISVDVAEFEQLATADGVLAAEREIAERRPEKLIVRVDRTDPSKNIVRGFRAFELYLEAHPEMRRRVGMLALLDPSRLGVPEYSEYVGAVQREARRVNDRFAENGWTPVDLQIADDFPRSVAAYKQFDVLLVNATMDGMNLVAKEAPLVNDRDGVLLLSENTGAFAELSEWAVPLNPFDVEAQAEAIDLALTMDKRERRDRLQAIRAHVRENDVNAWIDLQLAALDDVVPAMRR
jgi:trehalose 6-phosphate synthase